MSDRCRSASSSHLSKNTLDWKLWSTGVQTVRTMGQHNHHVFTLREFHFNWVLKVGNRLKLGVATYAIYPVVTRKLAKGPQNGEAQNLFPTEVRAGSEARKLSLSLMVHW